MTVMSLCYLDNNCPSKKLMWLIIKEEHTSYNANKNDK